MGLADSSTKARSRRRSHAPLSGAECRCRSALVAFTNRTMPASASVPLCLVAFMEGRAFSREVTEPTLQRPAFPLDANEVINEGGQLFRGLERRNESFGGCRE
jgi:hypothetical protein